MRHAIQPDHLVHAFVITKSDVGPIGSPIGMSLVLTWGADIPGKSCNYIYVGTTGNINLETKGGETVLFSNIPAGVILPIGTRAVLSTSTTASDMVGMY